MPVGNGPLEVPNTGLGRFYARGMPTTLPLFPLGSVLFPGVVMPLRVFEPRYRQLVEDLQALDTGEQRFGVVAIQDGREVGEGNVRSVYEYGCTAQISAVDAADDGSYALVTTGVERFRVLTADLAAGRTRPRRWRSSPTCRARARTRCAPRPRRTSWATSAR